MFLPVLHCSHLYSTFLPFVPIFWHVFHCSHLYFTAFPSVTLFSSVLHCFYLCCPCSYQYVHIGVTLFSHVLHCPFSGLYNTVLTCVSHFFTFLWVVSDKDCHSGGLTSTLCWGSYPSTHMPNSCKENEMFFCLHSATKQCGVYRNYHVNILWLLHMNLPMLCLLCKKVSTVMMLLLPYLSCRNIVILKHFLEIIYIVSCTSLLYTWLRKSCSSTKI